MTNELTIIEETCENKNKFHPFQYWVSPLLIEKENIINLYVHQILPGLRRTKMFGELKTLHIGTIKDINDYINSDIYFITFDVLDELVQSGFSHFQVSEISRQCLSLCLKDFCFAVSNSYKQQEFEDILKKISLLGGNFASINESDKIGVYITDFPILPQAILSNDNIEIITSDWIYKCYEQKEKVDFESYRLDNFQSLIISSSDLDPIQSKQIKSKIIKGGGKWSESLDNSVTFLVASHFASTPKIKLALEISVPIVKPKWIIEQSQNFSLIEPDILNFWILKNYSKSLLFSEKNFAIHVGCEDRNSVIEAVKAHSGTFSTSPDFLIVPHFFQTANDKKCVSVSWVWSCITQNKIIDPDSSILYRPLPYKKVSSKLKGYVIVLYHIENEIIRYEISECLRVLGCIVHYKISSMSNIVVAEKEEDKLFKLAKRYKVKIVSFPWVMALIQKGKLPSVNNYIFESKEEIALKTIRQGIKKIKGKSSDRSKDKFIFSQANNTSNILTQESLITFTDDETEIENTNSVEVTYEQNDTKRKRKKYQDDPLLDFLSKFDS